jgi:hypothetical protein
MIPDHLANHEFAIDPLTGLDAEDLFGQVEWCRERGLAHPCDGSVDLIKNKTQEIKL